MAVLGIVDTASRRAGSRAVLRWVLGTGLVLSAAACGGEAEEGRRGAVSAAFRAQCPLEAQMLERSPAAPAVGVPFPEGRCTFSATPVARGM